MILEAVTEDGEKVRDKGVDFLKAKSPHRFGRHPNAKRRANRIRRAVKRNEDAAKLKRPRVVNAGRKLSTWEHHPGLFPSGDRRRSLLIVFHFQSLSLQPVKIESVFDNQITETISIR